MSQPWTVHKFGGTSLASAERIGAVADILMSREEPRQAVVVSAMGGVTDTLIHLIERARIHRDLHDDEGTQAELRRLHQHLVATARALLPDASAIEARFDKEITAIRSLLRATALLGSASKETADLVSGYGELWSAELLCAVLQARGVNAIWHDARDALVVREAHDTGPAPDLGESEKRLATWVQSNVSKETQTIVITGYVASTPVGIATTLGRNGSDYSAAIYAALLEASELFIWTDVDGVMSANPRIVPGAVPLDSLSYEEAMELAYFGAKVLHPSTIAPAMAQGVVITIKNTFNTEAPGTRIGPRTPDGGGVKGFATIDHMALVNLEGTHMIGVPGIASRLFSSLKEAQISVVMISQASSEHSICFMVPEAQADRVREAVEAAFFAERIQGQIQTMDIHKGCSIIAVVGDHMAGQVGVAAQFFNALKHAGINIRAIAQGSSERNISAVIDASDSPRALRAVHAGFYLSAQTLSIGLLGAGSVGRELLEQIQKQRDVLLRDFNLDLRVRGITNSKKMVLGDPRIDLDGWATGLADGPSLDLKGFARHIHAEHIPHAVIVDCTASGDVAAHTQTWLDAGIHVVTPNKRANTTSWAEYQSLRNTSGAHYLYEATVGAGLPIIQTVRDLIQTGDEIRSIEGIFSGTLAYLFNRFDGSTPFSALVKEARELGYTEPDPRDDLSGMDVARKLVILAREAGMALELDDVVVESLIPEPLAGLAVSDFLARLSEYDEAMQDRLSKTKSGGEFLRFVGSVHSNGTAQVALQQVPRNHAFAHIQLTDNIVQFTTRRYVNNPLVVQGPGAGPEVTAGGIFGDLLRLASFLGTAR